MLSRCLRKVRARHFTELKQLLETATELQAASQGACGLRWYSKLPSEYAGYYGSSKQAIRKVKPVEAQPLFEAAQPSAPENSQPVLQGGSAAISQAGPDSSAVNQQEAAESVSRWMLPWEKRQMGGEKGPLRSWEKIYWWVFVSALAFLLWSRTLGSNENDPATIEDKAEKERKKLKAARMLLAGLSLPDEESEILDGMSPQEIQSFVETNIGATSDPFEGLTPQEINDMMSPSSRSSTPQLSS